MIFSLRIVIDKFKLSSLENNNIKCSFKNPTLKKKQFTLKNLMYHSCIFFLEILYFQTFVNLDFLVLFFTRQNEAIKERLY